MNNSGRLDFCFLRSIDLDRKLPKKQKSLAGLERYEIVNYRQKKRERQIQLFTRFLDFAGFFAKRPSLTPISNFILRRFADLTIRIRGGQKQQTVKELGKEWQRMFPSKAFVPIKEVDGDNVYAEIHGKCPVTATGDVRACHRLMEYDRRLMEHIGGEFIVLESKADPAVSICRIAIRPKGASLDDLTPAHEKPLKSD